MIKNVLVESYNFSTLLALIFIRGNKKVFLTDFIEYYPNNSKKNNIWMKAGNILFGSDHIIRFPCYQENFEKNSALLWKVNAEALQFLNQDQEMLSNTALGKYLNNIIQDKMVFIALKKLIQEKITRKTLFLNCLSDLEKNKVSLFRVLPDGEVPTKLLSFLNISLPIKLDSKIKVWTDVILQRISFFCYIVFSPYLVRDIFKKKVCITTPKAKEFFIGIHVANGIRSGGAFSDTNLLDHGKIDYEKSLFVFSFWQYSNEAMKNYLLEIRNKNSHYGYEYNNAIPLALFFNKYVKSYVRSLALLSECFSLNNSSQFFAICFVQKIIAQFFNQMVFCQYFKVKNFFSRDDYSFTHVIRTIVQNKFGLKNVGLQHSSFLYPKYIPQSAFTYFDIYFTGGAKFQSLWHPYWDTNKQIIPVGHKATMLVKKAMQDIQLKNKFKQKYNSKITILFLITAHNDSISPFWLLKKKYADIHRVFEIHQDIHLILKPRRADATESFLLVCPEIKHYISLGRCSVEESDFSTQELISCVDVLVSEDASSSLLESLSRKDLFSIFYMVRYGEFLPQKELVVNNGMEFCHMITSFIHKDKRFESTKIARDQMRSHYASDDDEDCMLKIAQNLKQLN